MMSAKVRAFVDHLARHIGRKPYRDNISEIERSRS